MKKKTTKKVRLTNAEVMTAIAGELINSPVASYLTRYERLRLDRIARCGFCRAIDECVRATFILDPAHASGYWPKIDVLFEYGPDQDEPDTEDAAEFIPGLIVFKVNMTNCDVEGDWSEFVHTTKFIENVTNVLQNISDRFNLG